MMTLILCAVSFALGVVAGMILLLVLQARDAKDEYRWTGRTPGW
jgi:hypothetical protein